MDGMLLPAIIYTNCPNILKGIADEYGGKIEYMPDLTALSAQLTMLV